MERGSNEVLIENKCGKGVLIEGGRGVTSQFKSK